MSEPCQQERVIELILERIDEIRTDVKEYRKDNEENFRCIERAIGKLNAFKFKIIGMGTLAGFIVVLIEKLWKWN